MASSLGAIVALNFRCTLFSLACALLNLAKEFLISAFCAAVKVFLALFLRVADLDGDGISI